MQIKKTVLLNGKVISEQVYNTVPARDQMVELVGTTYYLPISSIGCSFITGPGKEIKWTKM